MIAKPELLRVAHRRVSLPQGELWLDYQDDVDTLYVRLAARAISTKGSSSITKEKNWSESK